MCWRTRPSFLPERRACLLLRPSHASLLLSALFSFGDANPPIIARFLPGQRFDLQVTVSPDAGQTITGVVFKVDGNTVAGTPTAVTTGLVAGLPTGTAVYSLRAYSNNAAGVHTITATATQSNGATVNASSNFEVIGIQNLGKKTKNVIICIGDGMGAPTAPQHASC